MFNTRTFLAIPLMAGLLLAGTGFGSDVSADGTVQLVAMAEQEITTTDASGEVVIKRVEATKVVPGDEVIYTTRYSNGGDANAENVVISNPIPEHMRYKADSAFGDGAAIDYSIDDGRTFDSANNLKVIEDDGTVRVATASDYTHVRWVFSSELSPDQQGTVGFRAVLL